MVALKLMRRRSSKTGCGERRPDNSQSISPSAINGRWGLAAAGDRRHEVEDNEHHGGDAHECHGRDDESADHGLLPVSRCGDFGLVPVRHLGGR